MYEKPILEPTNLSRRKRCFQERDEPFPYTFRMELRGFTQNLPPNTAMKHPGIIATFKNIQLLSSLRINPIENDF